MTDLLDPVVSKRSRRAPAPKEAEGGMSVEPAKPKHSLRTGISVQQSDRELVLLSVEGNTAAYSELVNRYQDQVRCMAKSMVRDYQIAEDLAQDAFIKAYQSIADLKEPEKFGGWVCTILRHAALDFLRTHKHNVSLETLQTEGFEPPLEAPEPGSIRLESHEEEARVLEALRNLREDYREIIMLKHVEKMSYKDIASRLNMTVSAVGEKLSRVRALLKRRLEKLPVKPRDE